MLRYMLVVFLYTITYCMASNIKTDTSFNGLTASVQKLLPNTNENSTPAQQIIYICGPHQWKMQESSNLIEKVANGYSITPGIGAHKLHVDRMTWNEARKVCIQEGGHLAVINSISEEGILLQMIQAQNIDNAWLGIHDLYKEGDWNTIMDESLEAMGYSKWGSNQPDNFNRGQHCGVFGRLFGGMDDRECTARISFFCEIAL